MTHNPTLAKVYDLALLPSERLGVRRLRDRLASDLSGRVIEVAVGTGLNLPHYPPTAIVHGVDPDPHMLQKASKRALQAPAAIHLYRGDAHRLSFVDGSFDFAVIGFALCTVTRPEAALREAGRVIAPKGHIRFLEHVRSPRDRRARWQDRLAPAWERFAGGCRLNQDTLAILEAAGFRVERLWRSTKGGVVSSEARPT
jgi:ubiquinone/menaquinone biosynthesis C-methylase UbiE